MSIDIEFARRDDCLDKMVPSDLRELVGERDIAHGQVGDLSMLVRKLVHALRKAAPGHDLPDKAMDYLKRKGLQGSPLRDQAQSAPEPVQNQCDGCNAGVPLVDGMHRMGKPGGYSDPMRCQAEKYATEPVQGEAVDKAELQSWLKKTGPAVKPMEVIGYASPGQVEILRSLPRTGGMKVKGFKDDRYSEPVVLLREARSAVMKAVISCEKAGAFKTCMECGYQDGHDEICQYHESKRATDDPVAIIEYTGYEPANSLRWLNKGLAYMEPGTMLYTAAAKPDAEQLLTKPAKVGPGTFAAGLPARMVIEAAYRQYEYAQEPPFSDEQISAVAKSLGADNQRIVPPEPLLAPAHPLDADHFRDPAQMVDAELVELLCQARSAVKYEAQSGDLLGRAYAELLTRIDAKLAELQK